MDRKKHNEGFKPLKGFKSGCKAQHKNTCCHVWTGLISEHPWFNMNMIPTHFDLFWQSHRQFCWFCVRGCTCSGHRRGNKCGSQTCCGCRCRPAAGHETAAESNRAQPFKKTSAVCARPPHPTPLHSTPTYPSLPPAHWCQKNLRSSQRRARPLQLPQQQKKTFQIPSQHTLTIFTEGKVLSRRERGRNSVTEKMGKGKEGE